jgi:hypothetical protein
MTLRVVPLAFRDTTDFISLFHRHHSPPQGGKFCIGVHNEHAQLVGVAIVGRPVARMLDDGVTAEVTRLCVMDGEPNACSMLYGACARAAKAMGYVRIVTYILASETGTSLKASGWVRTKDSGGGTWSRPSREREDNHPADPKVRYERQLGVK